MADDSGTLSGTVSDSSNDRWKNSKTAKALRGAGSSLMSSSQSASEDDRITPVAFRKGGKIRKAKRKMKRSKARE